MTYNWGMNFNFVAIGDIVTDAFIRLSDAHVSCIDGEKCELCLSFKDKVPYDFVKVVPAVGNSANAAVAAARLGLKTALVTNIGDDLNGKECLAAIENENISTEFVKVNQGVPTNYHYVLWYESDRTILVKHERFAYELPDIGEPSWLYLSSMGENSLAFHDTIAAYLDNHPAIKLAFQPGTYQMKFGKEKLAHIYKRTNVFIANKEEYQRILATSENDVAKLMQAMRELGPKIVLLTDGPDGAYMDNGETAWFIPAYPDEKPPYDRTGAGDAFASTFVAALALGLSPDEALRWGPINSMSVVQYIGAREGLLTREKMESYIKDSPEYRARPLQAEAAVLS